ncbi:hypothetical protein [Sphingobacterium daejeonense]|uniref:hypothetical protein n=1 Tax=Sphingobacterium daejeonense TaxID=371142 RepID=UPI0010C26092|nr:hypothetical protein [Sphingobacterium daejeonense]VTQ00365.1 Uncharacterised protein [Sphingobacterium daejeonense]
MFQIIFNYFYFETKFLIFCLTNMTNIPKETIISTARSLLRGGIETNQKRITFPVTLSGELFYSKEAEIREIEGEMWTMYTVDCKQWLIKIEEEVFNLGIYPNVYTGD